MIRLTVNKKRRSYSGPPFKRLLDVLREDFGLTGTKEGCGEGECGACTVLVDGEAVNSCLVPVCQAEGRALETVESLGAPEKLNGLQRAFLEKGGAQCGICTPGMLMSATAYARCGSQGAAVPGGASRSPLAGGGGGKAQEGPIREALAGNLCRCTGYQHIVDSVLSALRAGKKKRARR